MSRRIQASLKLIVLLGLIIILASGCKETDDEDERNISSSSSGISSCSGRTSGIQAGPTNLYLPFPNGDAYQVGQSWFGTFSHSSTGREHALDFTMQANDDIWPVASGRVMSVKEDSNITCSSNCNDANYVVIDHGNGFIGKYFHFCQNCVDVNQGQQVDSDTKIGGAGNTGWSTGTHLHFELASFVDNCTVTYGFSNINSGASTALTTGTTYTSQNAGMAFADYIPSKITGTAYENVGITLTEGIDWYLSAGDTITVKGSLTAAAQTEGSNSVAVFLVDTGTDSLVTSPTTKSIELNVTDSFDFTYTIPAAVTAGRYNLCISKSTNGSYSWNNPPVIIIH